MATVAEALVTSGFEETSYPITSDVYSQMVEQGLVTSHAPDSRDGKRSTATW